MQRGSKLQRARTRPEPHDMDAVSKQVILIEERGREDRKAVYYPAESARGREVRDKVLAIGDILAVIFVHCLPVMPTNEYPYPSPRHAPMQVSHVCQYWRLVALSTPSLWSCFALENGFTNRLFRLWMKRSGTMPLSLSADKDSLSFVLPLSSRWKNMTFHLSSGCLPLLASTKNKIPNLHRLFVKFSRHDYSSWTYNALPSSLPTFDGFENAPNLRELSLGRPSCYLTLTFPQLVDLSIFGAPGAQYVIQCCQQASNIFSLAVTISAPPSVPSPLDPGPCHLFHLKTLCADDCSTANSSQLRPLLNNLNCPNLLDLEIGNTSNITGSKVATRLNIAVMNSLVSFLGRSPLLTRLNISIRHRFDDKLIDVLELCPNLEEFKVDRHVGTISAVFCAQLTYHHEDSAAAVLCSRLRIFDVGHTHALESAFALVGMVASRWNVVDGALVARLEKVVVNCEDEEGAEQLRQFGTDGLELSLPEGKSDTTQMGVEMTAEVDSDSEEEEEEAKKVRKEAEHRALVARLLADAHANLQAALDQLPPELSRLLSLSREES